MSMVKMQFCGLGSLRPSCFLLIAFAAFAPIAAAADTIHLKLSFFMSARGATYDSGVKPFVDQINAEGQGVLAIDVYPDGALGKGLAGQPKLVLDGVADIAWIVPGQTPYRFPDNELLDHPGLFRDAREGTLTYTRLVAANALRGYENYVVIAAVTPAPAFIHSRKPIGSLADLKDQRLRGNNPIEADALERLGALPTVLEVQLLADAIRRGALDGATLGPAAFFQYGMNSVAKNHYLLAGTASPLALVMNRKKFDTLPDAAKALILRYSGEWTAAAWIASFGRLEQAALDKLKSDPGHIVTEPSAADLDAAERIYRSQRDAWIARNPRNESLWQELQVDLAAIRSAK